MSKYLDDINRVRNDMTDVSYSLKRLSDLFFETGNEIMSDKLFNLATILSDSEKHLDKTVRDDINRALKQQQDASAELLNTLLKKGEKDEKLHIKYSG